MNKNRNIIAAIILLVVIAGGIYMFNSQTKLENQNKVLVEQVDSLLLEKAALIKEMEGFQIAFETEQSRADSLSTVLVEVQEQIAQRNIAAGKIKKQHTTEANALKKEIEELRQMRNEAEGFIAQLRNENAALLAKNNELTEAVTAAVVINDQLTSKGEALTVTNTQLEESVAKLKAASVKASAFQISVDKKSGKNTLSAKRAKAINISFDMNDIPAEHQGNHKLYLVITDEMGVPIKVDNPIRARITSNNNIAEIEAQQLKEIELSANQRIELIQSLDEKLKAGNYKATIYTEKGLIGSSSFKLS